eukprot:g10697.t1
MRSGPLSGKPVLLGVTPSSQTVKQCDTQCRGTAECGALEWSKADGSCVLYRWPLHEHHLPCRFSGNGTNWMLFSLERNLQRCIANPSRVPALSAAAYGHALFGGCPPLKKNAVCDETMPDTAIEGGHHDRSYTLPECRWLCSQTPRCVHFSHTTVKKGECKLYGHHCVLKPLTGADTYAFAMCMTQADEADRVGWEGSGRDWLAGRNAVVRPGYTCPLHSTGDCGDPDLIIPPGHFNSGLENEMETFDIDTPGVEAAWTIPMCDAWCRNAIGCGSFSISRDGRTSPNKCKFQRLGNTCSWSGLQKWRTFTLAKNAALCRAPQDVPRTFTARGTEWRQGGVMITDVSGSGSSASSSATNGMRAPLGPGVWADGCPAFFRGTCPDKIDFGLTNQGENDSHHYNDRPYSVAECRYLCSVTADCAVFALQNYNYEASGGVSGASCGLWKDGCALSASGSGFDFYRMSQCQLEELSGAGMLRGATVADYERGGTSVDGPLPPGEARSESDRGHAGAWYRSSPKGRSRFWLPPVLPSFNVRGSGGHRRHFVRQSVGVACGSGYTVLQSYGVCQGRYVCTGSSGSGAASFDYDSIPSSGGGAASLRYALDATGSSSDDELREVEASFALAKGFVPGRSPEVEVFIRLCTKWSDSMLYAVRLTDEAIMLDPGTDCLSAGDSCAIVHPDIPAVGAPWPAGAVRSDGIMLPAGSGPAGQVLTVKLELTGRVEAANQQQEVHLYVNGEKTRLGNPLPRMLQAVQSAEHTPHKISAVQFDFDRDQIQIPLRGAPRCDGCAPRATDGQATSGESVFLDCLAFHGYAKGGADGLGSTPISACGGRRGWCANCNGRVLTGATNVRDFKLRTGGACCRRGDVSDPIECQGVPWTAFKSPGHHECAYVDYKRAVSAGASPQMIPAEFQFPAEAAGGYVVAQMRSGGSSADGDENAQLVPAVAGVAVTEKSAAFSFSTSSPTAEDTTSASSAAAHVLERGVELERFETGGRGQSGRAAGGGGYLEWRVNGRRIHTDQLVGNHYCQGFYGNRYLCEADPEGNHGARERYYVGMSYAMPPSRTDSVLLEGLADLGLADLDDSGTSGASGVAHPTLGRMSGVMPSYEKCMEACALLPGCSGIVYWERNTDTTADNCIPKNADFDWSAALDSHGQLDAGQMTDACARALEARFRGVPGPAREDCDGSCATQNPHGSWLSRGGAQLPFPMECIISKQPGRDIPGHDLRLFLPDGTLRAASLHGILSYEQCMQACALVPDCVGIVEDTRPTAADSCWMKRGNVDWTAAGSDTCCNAGEVATSCRTALISGARLLQGGAFFQMHAPPLPPVCLASRQTDRDAPNGGGVPNLDDQPFLDNQSWKRLTYEQCMRACVLRTGCGGIVFIKTATNIEQSGGNCVLKSSASDSAAWSASTSSHTCCDSGELTAACQTAVKAQQLLQSTDSVARADVLRAGGLAGKQFSDPITSEELGKVHELRVALNADKTAFAMTLNGTETILGAALNLPLDPPLTDAAPITRITLRPAMKHGVRNKLQIVAADAARCDGCNLESQDCLSACGGAPGYCDSCDPMSHLPGSLFAQRGVCCRSPGGGGGFAGGGEHHFLAGPAECAAVPAARFHFANDANSAHRHGLSRHRRLQTSGVVSDMGHPLNPLPPGRGGGGGHDRDGTNGPRYECVALPNTTSLSGGAASAGAASGGGFATELVGRTHAEDPQHPTDFLRAPVVSSHKESSNVDGIMPYNAVDGVMPYSASGSANGIPKYGSYFGASEGLPFISVDLNYPRLVDRIELVSFGNHCDSQLFVPGGCSHNWAKPSRPSLIFGLSSEPCVPSHTALLGCFYHDASQADGIRRSQLPYNERASASAATNQGSAYSPVLHVCAEFGYSAEEFRDDRNTEAMGHFRADSVVYYPRKITARCRTRRRARFAFVELPPDDFTDPRPRKSRVGELLVYVVPESHAPKVLTGGLQVGGGGGSVDVGSGTVATAHPRAAASAALSLTKRMCPVCMRDGNGNRHHLPGTTGGMMKSTTLVPNFVYTWPGGATSLASLASGSARHHADLIFHATAAPGTIASLSVTADFDFLAANCQSADRASFCKTEVGDAAKSGGWMSASESTELDSQRVAWFQLDLGPGAQQLHSVRLHLPEGCANHLFTSGTNPQATASGGSPSCAGAPGISRQTAAHTYAPNAWTKNSSPLKVGISTYPCMLGPLGCHGINDQGYAMDDPEYASMTQSRVLPKSASTHLQNVPASEIDKGKLDPRFVNVTDCTPSPGGLRLNPDELASYVDPHTGVPGYAADGGTLTIDCSHNPNAIGRYVFVELPVAPSHWSQNHRRLLYLNQVEVFLRCHECELGRRPLVQAAAGGSAGEGVAVGTATTVQVDGSRTSRAALASHLATRNNAVPECESETVFRVAGRGVRGAASETGAQLVGKGGQPVAELRNSAAFGEPPVVELPRAASVGESLCSVRQRVESLSVTIDWEYTLVGDGYRSSSAVKATGGRGNTAAVMLAVFRPPDVPEPLSDTSSSRGLNLQWEINSVVVDSEKVEPVSYACEGVGNTVWASTEHTVVPIKPAAPITSARIMFSTAPLAKTALSIELEDSTGTITHFGLDGLQKNFFTSQHLPGQSDPVNPNVYGPNTMDVARPMLLEYKRFGESVKMTLNGQEKWGTSLPAFPVSTVITKIGLRPSLGAIYVGAGLLPAPGSSSSTVAHARPGSGAVAISYDPTPVAYRTHSPSPEFPDVLAEEVMADGRTVTVLKRAEGQEFTFTGFGDIRRGDVVKVYARRAALRVVDETTQCSKARTKRRDHFTNRVRDVVSVATVEASDAGAGATASKNLGTHRQGNDRAAQAKASGPIFYFPYRATGADGDGSYLRIYSVRVDVGSYAEENAPQENKLHPWVVAEQGEPCDLACRRKDDRGAICDSREIAELDSRDKVAAALAASATDIQCSDDVQLDDRSLLGNPLIAVQDSRGFGNLALRRALSHPSCLAIGAPNIVAFGRPVCYCRPQPPDVRSALLNLHSLSTLLHQKQVVSSPATFPASTSRRWTHSGSGWVLGPFGAAETCAKVCFDAGRRFCSERTQSSLVHKHLFEEAVREATGIHDYECRYEIFHSGAAGVPGLGREEECYVFQPGAAYWNSHAMVEAGTAAATPKAFRYSTCSQKYAGAGTHPSTRSLCYCEAAPDYEEFERVLTRAGGGTTSADLAANYNEQERMKAYSRSSWEHTGETEISCEEICKRTHRVASIAELAAIDSNSKLQALAQGSGPGELNRPDLCTDTQGGKRKSGYPARKPGQGSWCAIWDGTRLSTEHLTAFDQPWTLWERAPAKVATPIEGVRMNADGDDVHALGAGLPVYSLSRISHRLTIGGLPCGQWRQLQRLGIHLLNESTDVKRTPRTIRIRGLCRGVSA